MGFARLYFPNNNTVPLFRAVHDIAGVLTGNITQVSSLTMSSDTRLYSQIFNTANSNWSIAFWSTTAWSTPNTANTSIVLQAPCATAGKIKYIRLGQLGSTINTSSTDNYTSSIGLIMQSCTAAASATSLTNQTTWNSGAVGFDGTHGLAGNYVTLHWSNRHCIMTGYKGAPTSQLGRRVLMAALEHNETTISQWANTAPVSHMVLDSYNVPAAAASTSFNYTSTYSGTGSTSMSSSTHSFLTEMQHFNNITQVATGVYNPLSNTNTNSLIDDFTLTTSAATDYPTVNTKTNTGSTAIYMQPLFYHQHTLGIPHMYYSNLANVYRVAPNLGSEGDLITIGADTYVYIPVTNWYALAVKRA